MKGKSLIPHNKITLDQVSRLKRYFEVKGDEPAVLMLTALCEYLNIKE